MADEVVWVTMVKVEVVVCGVVVEGVVTVVVVIVGEHPSKGFPL